MCSSCYVRLYLNIKCNIIFYVFFSNRFFNFDCSLIKSNIANKFKIESVISICAKKRQVLKARIIWLTCGIGNKARPIFLQKFLQNKCFETSL